VWLSYLSVRDERTVFGALIGRRLSSIVRAPSVG
jgi:hypothetical protein